MTTWTSTSLIRLVRIKTCQEGSKGYYHYNEGLELIEFLDVDASTSPDEKILLDENENT